MDVEKCQNDIASWSKQNFPPDDVGGKIHPDLYIGMTLILHRFGEACHSLLKTEQGIRGDDQKHRGEFIASLLDVNHRSDKLTDLADDEQSAFAARSDYADPDEYRPIRKLFGVVEECGELVSAYNMGVNPDRQKVKDSIADIFIFLCDLADSLDIDLEEAIEETLDDVLDRDWRE